MIARALLVAASLVSHAALAAQPPRNAAEFAQLPALGRLVEGGMEKDYRFRTYLVGKNPTSTGAKTASLHVNAGGGAGTKTVALSGTGT